MDEPRLGVLLFVPYRHMEQQVLRALADAGYAITLAQARMAARIDPGGSRIGRLAESAQVTKATAGYLVDQLVDHGYVERVADPSDARGRIVRFTALGHRMGEVAQTAEAEVERQWREHLGEATTASLVESLRALRDITDPYLAD